MTSRHDLTTRISVSGIDVMVCMKCGLVDPPMDKACPYGRYKCVNCGLMTGEVGFPECYVDGRQFSVSHDMQPNPDYGKEANG